MIHRAILGSLERFMGILIENYAGAACVSLASQAQSAQLAESGKQHPSVCCCCCRCLPTMVGSGTVPAGARQRRRHGVCIWRRAGAASSWSSRGGLFGCVCCCCCRC